MKLPARNRSSHACLPKAHDESNHHGGNTGSNSVLEANPLKNDNLAASGPSLDRPGLTPQATRQI